LPDSVAAYDLTGVFEQNSQQLEWLFLKLDSRPFSLKLANLQIDFEATKLIDQTRFRAFLHLDHANFAVLDAAMP
jgi:hypothetical protein